MARRRRRGPVRGAPVRRVLVSLLLALGVLASTGAPALAGVLAGAGAQTDTPSPAEEPPVPVEASAESITARLFDTTKRSRPPIVGVTVVVRRGNETVGRAETDDEGEAIIPVPGPGSYEVRLVADSITERQGEPNRARLRDVIVVEGRTKFVLFPFGEREQTRAGGFDRIVDLAGGGLRLGLIVAVAAVGLSLVFGTTGLINFAHGELLAFGAIVAWYFNSESGGLGIPLVFAGVIAVVFGGLFGGGLERVLWRPLRRRRTGNVALLVVSIGLGLFLRSTYQIVFGSTPKSYEQYAVQRTWAIGPLDILPKSVGSIAICLVILVAVALLLLKTRLGTAVRAVTDNQDLSESSGIDVQRVILAVWVTCGALAAAAGVLLGMTQTVEYDMGFKVLLVIFAAMILGGLGSAFGAMVGGIILGVTLEVSTFWVPTDFKNAIALGVLILALLVRPQGILGVRERIG